jgi:hypothetical protein
VGTDLTGRQPGLLTEDEMAALDLLKDLTQLCTSIIAPGRELEADHSELVLHVHAIQRMIMAQAAARAYPQKFRLLGKGWADE